MAQLAKFLSSTAGVASGSGGGLDVDDCFSTTLYDGTGANQAINNGIDLSGEGGLVWLKSRNGSSSAFHTIYDTARGTGPNGGRIFGGTASTSAASTQSDGLQSFNSNGFTLGANLFENGTNASYGTEYCSWTFRKAPKFFSCVSWSGDGTDARQISHNLSTTIGSIFVKNTSSANTDWMVYHRSCTDEDATHCNSLVLNQDYAQLGWKAFGKQSTQTSSVFTLGTNSSNEFFFNQSGQSYVAYIFAHNDSGDGGFGPDGDQDAIVCSSYTGGTTGTEVNVGFEPQFLMIKRASGSGDWMMFDAMRGVVNSAYPNLDNTLFANLSNAERTNTGYIGFTPTGFVHQGASSDTNTNGDTYVYIAVRRGSLNVPDDPTKVFAISTNGQAGDSTAPAYRSTFPVDMYFEKSTGGSPGYISSRLTGPKYMQTNATSGEASDSNLKYDFMNGVYNSTGSSSSYYGYMWKRAPSFFDAQAFSLGNSSNREVKHNLQAIPEMIWWKERSSTSYWLVWHKSFTSSQYMTLHLSSPIASVPDLWGTSAHTSTGWYMKETAFGTSGDTCVSYTFATAPGVSKVGSYSGNGGTQNIECGFSNGSRFILIKRTDNTEGWKIHDSVRGIVSGDDPFLELNNTNAQNSSFDLVDPYSGGFAVNNFAGWNASGGSYIFYAIA